MVEFKFGIDDGPVQAGFRRIGTGARNLSHEINSGIKESFAEAFSVALISEMVSKEIEFADAVVKGAENLDITTDSFQALKIAAREAHKDMSLFEKSFANIEKAASAALGGDSKTKNAFKNLHISDEDLKNLDKVALLQKILAGTQGQSRNESVANLNALGIKSANANGLLAVQPQLADFKNFKGDLKENGQIASNEQLNNLAELKDKWEDFTDELKVSVIPGLNWLISAVMDFVKGIRQGAQLIGTVIGALLGNIQNCDFGGLIKAFGQNLFNGFKALFENLWDVIRGKISVTEALGNLGAEKNQEFANLTVGAFGQKGAESIAQVVNEQLAEFAEEDKKDEAKSEQRKRNREESEKTKEGPANRVAAVKGDTKSILDNELKGAETSLVKIGALGGINDAYRLVRLSQEANNYLRQIAQNTSPSTGGGGDIDNEFTD